MSKYVSWNGKKKAGAIISILAAFICVFLLGTVLSFAEDIEWHELPVDDLTSDIGSDGLSVTIQQKFTEKVTISKKDYYFNEDYVTTAGNLFENFCQRNYNSVSNGEISFYAESLSLGYKSSDNNERTRFPTVVSTLSLTNTTSYAMKISFTYGYTTSNSGTVTVDGTTFTAPSSSGISFSKTIAGGESIVIILQTSNKSGSKGSATISGITAKAEATQQVTFKVADGGSYVVAANDTTYEIISEQAISIDLSKPITLTATPATGKRFAYWTGDDSVIFSSENGLTINKISGNSVAPYFCDEDAQPNFVTGFASGSGIECFYWEEAFKTATFFEDYSVVLLAGEHSLPATLAGNGLTSDGEYVKEVNGEIRYIVPEGYKFLVPYAKRSNGTYDLSLTGRYNSEDHTSAYTTAYSTLVLNTGTKVVVNGTMIVGAQQHTTGGGGKIMGEVGAKCGAVKMMGGYLDVYGTLYARGYIYDPSQHTVGNGNGKVIAEAGADIYVFLQLNDFRGGTASLQGSNNDELALNVYYFDNILATTVFKYGSELYGTALLYAGETFMDAETALFTDNDNIECLCLLQSDCELITDYDVANDVFIMDIYKGHAKIKNLKVQLGSFSLDTEGKTLPLNEGLNVVVESGATVDVYCSLKCLPGFKMYVEENATVNLHKTLYLYSVSTYQQAWARDEMRRRQNCEFVRYGGQLIAPTEDAVIYVNGTFNVDEGLKIFESSDHSGSIIPGENAQFNLASYMSYSANTDFLYEIPGTVSNQSQYAQVRNWVVFKGPVADLSTSVTDTASLSRENLIDAGSYSTVDLGDGYYWYRYAVEYANGGNTVATHYHAIQTTDVLAPAELTLAGQKNVVTAYTKTSDGSEEITVTGGWTNNGSPVSNLLTEGWETMSLAGVNSDTTVTLTLKPYDNRVVWTINGTGTVAHYITGSSDTYSDTVVASVQNCVVTDENGDPVSISAVPSYTENTTAVTLSGISCDVRASVTTSTDFILVTWNLTYGTDGGSATYYSRVAVGNTDCVFAIPQISDNTWYVAASADDITVTGGAAASSEKETVTVTGLTDTGVTANVYLTKYDQKVSFEVSGSDAVYPAQFINNGGEIVLDTVAGYIFDSALVKYDNGNGYVSDNSATAAVTDWQRKLTVSGTTHTDNKVMITMAAYDCAVSFVLDGSEVSVAYIDNGGDASYTLPAKTAFTGLTVDGTATDASANATPAGNAVLGVSGVQSDVTVSAETLQFRSIVSFHETLGGSDSVKYSYLPLGATSAVYNVENGKVVTGVSGATVSGPSAETVNASDVSLGWETFTVTGLGNSDSDVYVTLRAYDKRVTWIIREGENSETTIHYVAGYSDEYNTAANYVIKSYQVSYEGNAAVTDSTSKTRFAFSEIDGEPTATLTVARYVSVVTFEDTSHNVLSGPIYVDETGRNIFNVGGEVFYEPAASHVITAVSFASGSATLNSARWSNARFGNDALAGFRDEITLTGISSGEVTVTVTEREYSAKVRWNITKEGVSESYLKFITGTTDSYTVTDTGSTDFRITLENSSKLTAVVSDDEKTVELTGISDGAIISISITDESSKLFTGHSITLHGNIDLNFYVNLTEEQIDAGATVVYTWGDGNRAEYSVSDSDFVSGRGFKTILELPPAEMTAQIHAVVVIDETEQTEVSDYSVRDYALTIISDTTGVYSAELKDLVKAMLDYGAKAQEVFEVDTTHPANGGNNYITADVTVKMIEDAIAEANPGITAPSMRDSSLASYGLEYQYSTVVFLSRSTLRHYYSVVSPTQYAAAKANGVVKGFDESQMDNGYVYIEFTDIPAAQLAVFRSFTIGGKTYYSSVLTYSRAVIKAGTGAPAAETALAKATYWYYIKALAYFND